MRLRTVAGLLLAAALPAAGALRADASAGAGSALDEPFSPLFERRLEVGLLNMDAPEGARLRAALIAGESGAIVFSGSITSWCLGSGCGGSACLGSACLGSTCLGSGCLDSKCVGSACGGSQCIGSLCGASQCLGSACTQCAGGEDQVRRG
ncbi:MAG TPA: hypothetical protein VJV23_16465 [Candidatus Polarisedimenticolia bacterium]|nr:hypothetical protein [Candidatus Polarisedimenticolia bacterium]